MERIHSCTASMPDLNVMCTGFLLVIAMNSLESILLGENALQFDDDYDQSLLALKCKFHVYN